MMETSAGIVAKLGGGNDFVSFNSSTYNIFLNNSNINFGGGDDILSVNAGTSFGGKTKFNGGGGKNDQIFADDPDINNQPDGAQIFLNGFELGDVSAWADPSDSPSVGLSSLRFINHS
ncbi:MAG: hypothetical protein R3C01_08520 [Planctomycetaceae bacterium]